MATVLPAFSLFLLEIRSRGRPSPSRSATSAQPCRRSGRFYAEATVPGLPKTKELDKRPGWLKMKKVL
jgi:hypothetical protein